MSASHRIRNVLPPRTLLVTGLAPVWGQRSAARGWRALRAVPECSFVDDHGDVSRRVDRHEGVRSDRLNNSD
jgi:hypothetical protein